MTIALEDAFGNAAAAVSSVTVSLTTTLAAGQFIDGHGNVLPYPAPLTIPTGGSTVNFQYADTMAGEPLLTADAIGYVRPRSMKPSSQVRPVNWTSSPPNRR